MKAPVRYTGFFLISLWIAYSFPLLNPGAEASVERDSVQTAEDPVLEGSGVDSGRLWPYETREIANALEILLADWNESMFAVDDSLIRHVCYFYKYYAMVDSEGSNEVIRRGRRYLPYIKKVFREYHLPEELAFAVPFVESAFKNEARSNKKAVGLFQFLKNTAKAYGLEVNARTDERMDYQKSAVACAEYLSENRNVFGSAVLSLGSFHHGTSKLIYVLRHLPMKENKRAFVSIFNNRELGKYSKEYIPKCLAASLMYRFMKTRSLSEIPKMNISSTILGRFAYVSDLKKDIPKINLLNPDLENALTTYIYATTRGYLLVDDANEETISYLQRRLIRSRTVVASVTQNRRKPVESPVEEQVESPVETHDQKESEPIVSSEDSSATSVTEKSESPVQFSTVDKPGEKQAAVPAAKKMQPPAGNQAPVEKPNLPEQIKPAVGELMKIPQLTGRKWLDNIRSRYPEREIVKNESYTGNIEDLGVIIDQNLKPGDIWRKDRVLIIEVGRPPVPEDNLSEEEYSKFTREYMMKLRNGETF